jgi:integrase
LSEPAILLLDRQEAIRLNDHVFPGTSRASVSNNACALLLRRMGHGNITLHGFRSSFRDWVAERTGFESEVAEAALGHRIPDRTRAAYERGDKFEKRRRLMRQWATFCASAPTGAVVPIRATVP